MRWEASYTLRLNFIYPNTKLLPAACTVKENCFLFNLSLSICVSNGRCWEDGEWVESQTSWITELKSISISTCMRGNWQGAALARESGEQVPVVVRDSAVMGMSKGDGTRLFLSVLSERIRENEYKTEIPFKLNLNTRKAFLLVISQTQLDTVLGKLY